MKVTTVFVIVSSLVMVCSLAQQSPSRPRIRAISNSEASRSKIDSGFRNEGRTRSRAPSDSTRSRAETRLREARPKVEATRPKFEPKPKVEPVRPVDEIVQIEDNTFEEPIVARTEATPRIENNPNLIKTEDSPKAEISQPINTFGNALGTG